MKLNDLRPCDNHYLGRCDNNGKLAPNFYLLRVSQALIKHREAAMTMGMAEYFGSMDLAEMFSPSSGDEVLVFGDKEEDLIIEVFLCSDCVLMKDLNIASLLEAAARHKEKTDKQKSGEVMGDEAD